MPIVIQGATYYNATEVLAKIDVSRQTLYRWRQSGKIPQGRRFRDRSILFTPSEVEQITQFANHMEPIGQSPAGQMALFGD